MKIEGIMSAIGFAAHELIDSGIDNYYDVLVEKCTTDFKKRYEDFCVSLLDRYPYTRILSQIEKDYGNFVITIYDEGRFKGKDKIASTLLFMPEICELTNPNLLFYDKSTYKDSFSHTVRGINLEDMAFKYVSKCLDNGLLIRYKNGDGHGYATANIRELILTSGVQIQCIK